jgi:hypothetical protein
MQEMKRDRGGAHPGRKQLRQVGLGSPGGAPLACAKLGPSRTQLKNTLKLRVKAGAIVEQRCEVIRVAISSFPSSFREGSKPAIFSHIGWNHSYNVPVSVLSSLREPFPHAPHCPPTHKVEGRHQHPSLNHGYKSCLECHRMLPERACPLSRRSCSIEMAFLVDEGWRRSSVGVQGDPAYRFHILLGHRVWRDCCHTITILVRYRTQSPDGTQGFRRDY